jgi:hypothetical protein
MKASANAFSGLFVLVLLVAILVPTGRMEPESAKAFKTATRAVGIGSLLFALGCWAAGRQKEKP